jgi:RNA polymerase sigma-70 factor (ECF subfamily)
MNPDLDQYWQQITRGDEQALEKLYKKVTPALVHYAESITGESNMAEEVVQDVMLKLWQDRFYIVIQGSFKSYLFRTVHNHALNTLRHQKTKKQSVNRPGSDELWQFITDHYDLDDQSINQLYADQTGELINQVVDELPEQCRKVFRMSRFEALGNEEIAKQLELSENTIKTHIYKALQKISEVLKRNL